MNKVMNISRALRYSIAMGILLFGRYPLSKLVSSSRKIQRPDQIESEERFWIKSSTGNILYIEFEGPKEAQPLILIHGLNSSLQQWYYQRLYFRNDYRLVLIDLPGHGKSLPPKEFTVDAIVNDVKTIIDHFNISHPVLYGHSLGGMAILKYCIRHQMNPKLKGVVIQHSTYTNALRTVFLSPLLQLVKKPFIIPFLRFACRNNYFIWFLVWINFLNGINHLFFWFIYFTGNQTSEQLRYVTLIAAKNSPATIARGLMETFKYDVAKELPQIKVPALILGATNDRLTKLEASEYIHRHIRNSEMKVVNEGHLSLMENSPDVNLTVATFLEKL